MLSFAFVLIVQAGTPDSWITTKARLALATTEGVKSGDIHIDTNEGVVTLYGHVPTAAQKAAAEKRVKEIKGVKRVDSTLQIVAKKDEQAYDKSDDWISKEAKDRIDNNAALKDESVKVLSVDKGVVVLGGKAKDPDAHLAAIDCVNDVPGVRKVESRVTVENDTPTLTDRREGSGAGDSWLTTKVKLALASNKDVPSTAVHVDTHRKAVTLWGVVESDVAKREAEREAKTVDGVASVKNELIVDPAKAQKREQLSDAQIEDNVKRLLSKEEQRGIDVDVEDGIVKLSGKTDSEYERARVALASRTAKGARAVKNEIKVEKK